MAQSAVPDKLSMLCYLTQVHELFRGEIPCVKQPKRVHTLLIFFLLTAKIYFISLLGAHRI